MISLPPLPFLHEQKDHAMHALVELRKKAERFFTSFKVIHSADELSLFSPFENLNMHGGFDLDFPFLK